MLTRLSGTLDALEGLAAVVTPPGGLSYQVLVPAYVAERLRDRPGAPVTLHTIQYFEAQGPGGAMIPRLIGFTTVEERRFFELLTSVDGMGNRKALRALAQEPALIARAIAGADAAWLTRLPEIGRKTAEKVILELKDKITPFLTAAEVAGLEPDTGRQDGPVPAAISALIALGEARPDAERMVRAAMLQRPGLTTPDQIVAAALGS
jgi:Holliday junction DNA helicase RuvA